MTRVPPRLAPSPNGINPEVNAIVVWQIEQARKRARAADTALAGASWGPLHGIPLTAKDCSTSRACRPRWAIRYGKDNTAPENPLPIERLLRAGAIVFGKTNVPYMLPECTSSAKRESN
jgi:amidase